MFRGYALIKKNMEFMTEYSFSKYTQNKGKNSSPNK
jgi:hypothetical protein